jgi:peroxiredoxin
MVTEGTRLRCAASRTGNFGAEVFGLSTQSTDYQREVHARLHLSLDPLSDRLSPSQTHLRCLLFHSRLCAYSGV